MIRRTFLALAAVLMLALSVRAMAFHEVTFKGTVASVTATAIKVAGVDDKTKKPVTKSFDMDKETKILRGDSKVTFAAAKIQAGEKVAVTIDHDVDETLAITVRLDAKK